MGRRPRSSPSGREARAWRRGPARRQPKCWNAGRTLVNTGAPWPTLELDAAKARVQEIQTKLHRWASDDPHRRFCDLYNLVGDPALLLVAWDRVRGNKGARTAGVDGQTAYYIQAVRGLEGFLAELRADLKARTFQPLPVRQRAIPKQGGKLRRLGIATLASNCTSCRSGWGWGLEVGRVGHLLTAGRLDLGWEWHAPAAGWGAAGLELAVLHPVVDGVGADAKTLGDVGHAQLAGGEGCGCWHVVDVAEPAHGLDVERSPAAGQVAGLVQLVGQLGVGSLGAEPPQQLDHAVWGAPRLDGGGAAAGEELLGSARVPADADAELGPVGLGQHGDVSDQRAKHPLAVLGRGRRRVPQPREVAGQRVELGGFGERGELRLGGGQGLFGFGLRDELGFPAGLQAACYQAVFRLAGHKRPLGPFSLVAGALGGQLRGPADTGPPVGNLGGGGQRQRDLLWVQRREQPLGDRVVQGGRPHRAAVGCGHLVGASGRALIGGVPVTV